MLDYYLASVIAFVVIIGLWIIKDWKNIEKKFGILFLRRTKRGRKFIYKLADSAPRFWAFFGDLGIIVGFAGMVGGLYFIIKQSITAPEAGPGLSLVLPIPSSTATAGTGFVGVPFWYFIISIFILVIVHEGMHGVLTRNANVKIKSMGLALLAVLPGAFVEPDEKQLKKKSLRKRLRVYAAGSVANFVVAGIMFILLFGLTPIFTENGIAYRGYVDSEQFNVTSFPAQENNLTGLILSIDGIRVNNIDEFLSVMLQKVPGDTIDVETTTGNFLLELDSNPNEPEKAFIGIGGVGTSQIFKEQYRENSSGIIINFFLELFSWIGLLNLGIGLVNLLPIKPLDGGLMFNDTVRKLFPNNSDMIIRATTAFVIVIIAYSILGGFFI